ncbi:class I SAM-dependent methyltransferase [Aquimarina brevivitae]|uniref:Methyltransferase family protein n=1 Tax=Aquimarina brevivitae TaxID=323412 RepID=A0A4Q7NZX8_9FLAO|nr:class I SAM-dependent methyltransferase [Aquimarina brevivitae]RZS93066.1 methyltransferase family protein [Aquimarina brevivitae]
MNPDIFGAAIQDYYADQYSEDIVVQAADFDDDSIPIPYLFRSYEEMPPLEQKALSLCRGTVLDVGCGAGSHALYLQNECKLQVTAIDSSAGAIGVCQQRGVQQAEVSTLYDWKKSGFDTIILLMNGSGIIGRLQEIDRFFTHLKSLLQPNGQVLIDSSDLAYLFMEEDGGFWVDAAAGYYGEMQYRLQYKNQVSDWFDWLYLDYNTLQNAANHHGFVCELAYEGDHYDYLAQLTWVDS